MKISIIIPTHNEEENIGELVHHLFQNANRNSIDEILVVDSKSDDKTVHMASMAGATVHVSEIKGRSSQMNKGAEVAKGDILYFLHADSYPPSGFDADIIHAVSNNFYCGCYRLSFGYNHWFLQMNSWFTRFDVNNFRFGDQSLFITRDLFHKVKGFREDLVIMEDQEIIYRIKRESRFKILNKYVTTSARKYLANGIFKMQFIFFLVYFLYHFGCSQERLLKVYKQLIQHGKL